VIDWDAELLAPVMGIFGEGTASQPASLPFYTPRGLPGFPLPDAVFDSEYRAVTELAEDARGATVTPVLGVRRSLFPLPPRQNDTVYIPSVDGTFIVTNVQPDGHGHVLLILMGPVL